jgi:hypothetical protein
VLFTPLTINCFLIVSTGQVVALFVVGLGEYATVWLGTDWDKEVQKGIERNKLEDAATVRGDI